MKKTLLVVDDSPDVTFAIKALLEKDSGDYEVVISESGEDCLKMLDNDFVPDAILLDIMLPGMDGIETFEKLREFEKLSKVPIIFLTARTDQFTTSQGRYLGDDFIEKPFEIDDVKIRIERAIDNLKS